MNKAVPEPARPFSRQSENRLDWQSQMESYDRRVRRWNKKFKDRVIRIDQGTVSLITSDRKLNLDQLNDLTSVREYEDDN
ncbi:MAG: hypothetical protein NTY09_12680 [bacterium]|nr:hypothetical protein [bacterium]